MSEKETFRWRVELTPADAEENGGNGGWYAVAPELGYVSAHAWGKTPESALFSLRSVVGSIVGNCEREGLCAPEPDRKLYRMLVDRGFTPTGFELDPGYTLRDMLFAPRADAVRERIVLSRTSSVRKTEDGTLEPFERWSISRENCLADTNAEAPNGFHSAGEAYEAFLATNPKEDSESDRQS